MKLLIVGSGGREHALAWKLAQSARVDRLYIAPGNAGTALTGRNISISADDVHALLRFAQDNAIDLTIVGPEAPLAAGIVDAFGAAGLKIFGPTRAAAQLEASKAFAKAFMLEHSIPTAQYATFTDDDEARRYVDEWQRPVVVKASGLAGGKGVFVCDTPEDAHSALRQIVGAGEQTVVLEERLTGREVSVLSFCDGKTIVPMPPARDHKRVYDHDKGANTGGMGAFAPVPEVDAVLLDEICRTVLQPAVDGMAARGTPYVGVLYAGLMLTPDGLRTLEFNSRFGDPETQVLLPLLDSDLVEIMLACVDGTLDKVNIRWKDSACATVVLAAPGYPDSYPKGLPITGVEAVEDALVFHAGTTRQNDQLVTWGGRVLAVTGLGSDLDAALQRAYGGVGQICFDGMHYRRDIGKSSQT